MYKLLFVFLGGGLGSVCRYALTDLVDQKHASYLPYGTLASNLLACFIFGMIAGYALKHQIQEQVSLFLLAGFCGGFSTFSTFSKDNFNLLQQGHYMHLSLNVFLSIALGIFGFFLGLSLIRYVQVS